MALTAKLSEENVKLIAYQVGKFFEQHPRKRVCKAHFPSGLTHSIRKNHVEEDIRKANS